MYGTLANVQQIHTFNVGIYLRLSRDDLNAQESESITNQRDYLTRYVIENGWNLVDEYVDDGWTGINFDRPDFKRMIGDIEKKRINTIVTKDLSRLGRDYIDLGHYVERYFPERNIRYIAINDGIDTFQSSSNNDMTPFRAVMNDMYAKDISKKVRSILDGKRKNGQYIGSFAPYGYKKDGKDKHTLAIDEEVAHIVRRIFSMFVEGQGYKRIATSLNQEGVPCPTAYKEATGNYKNAKIKSWLWNHVTIRKILTNPTYMGDVAQRKNIKVNYKSKVKKNLSREQWLVVQDTHEPIINEEVFLLVQDMLQRKCGYSSKETKGHILTGLIFCGNCGEKMTFHQTKEKTYCVCSRYRRFTKEACSSHSVREDHLEQFVLDELRGILGQMLNEFEFAEMVRNRKSGDNIELQKEASRVEARLNAIKHNIKSLYEDKLKGILTETDFYDLSQEYNKERDSLVMKLDSLMKSADKGKQVKTDTKDVICMINEFFNMDKPSKQLVSKLIEKIEVFEEQNEKIIKVQYKFRNPFQK